MITTNLTETRALKQVIVIFQEKTMLKRSHPELLPMEKLQEAHALVKNLFSKVDIPKV